MVPTGTAGTVIVTTAGGRTCSPEVDCFGGFPSAASFNVTGASSQAYVITLPPDGTVTLTGLGAPMAVDAFNDSLAGAGTLDGTGNQSFTVGATLSVGAAQAADTYSGLFTVTVNYN